MEIWIKPIISSLSALIIGTLIGHWLQKFLYRPRVTIEVGNNVIYEHNGGFYQSVTVSNNGHTVAENCVGAISFYNLKKENLLSENKVANNEFLPTNVKEQLLTKENFREIDRELLCWAYIGNPDKYNINPGMKTLLDIYKAIFNHETGEWYFAIPTECGWNKIRVRLKDGTYHGQIMISPSNGKKFIKQFVIISSSKSNDNKPKFYLN